MGISKSKKIKAERKRRVGLVNARSLDGKGKFLDADYERYAAVFIATGDTRYLTMLPDHKPEDR